MKIKILTLITLISFFGSIESKNSKSNTTQEETSEASKKGLIRKLSDWIENRTTSEIIKAGATMGFLHVFSSICILEALKGGTIPTIVIWKDRESPTIIWKDANNNKHITKTRLNLWYLSSAKEKTIAALSAAAISTFGYSLLFASTRYANHKLRKWYGIDDSKETSQNIDLTSNNQQTTKPLI